MKGGALQLILAVCLIASSQIAATSLAARAANGAQVAGDSEAVSETRVLRQTTTESDALAGQQALPEYENLDEARAAISKQWDLTRDMVREDWRQAKAQFHRDYEALKRQIVKLFAE